MHHDIKVHDDANHSLSSCRPQTMPNLEQIDDADETNSSSDELPALVAFNSDSGSDSGASSLETRFRENILTMTLCVIQIDHVVVVMLVTHVDDLCWAIEPKYEYHMKAILKTFAFND